jgi:hypothetical protein
LLLLLQVVVAVSRCILLHTAELWFGAVMMRVYAQQSLNLLRNSPQSNSWTSIGTSTASVLSHFALVLA